MQPLLLLSLGSLLKQPTKGVYLFERLLKYLLFQAAFQDYEKSK